MSKSAHPACDAPSVAVIACAVLEAEIERYYRQVSGPIVHVGYLEQGLHNEPDRLRERLQREIEDIEERIKPETIVLGYGLCRRGTEGVRTTRARLVIARAQDCITHLLGSKEHYAQYVAEHPGTYWYSPGWNKHHDPPGKKRYENLLAQYTERYGEDNAEYLMDMEQHWFKTYDRATYVHLTVGATDGDIAFSKACADWLGWNFDMQPGDPRLLADLLTGPWDDERFVVCEPGQTFRLCADERVIERVDRA